MNEKVGRFKAVFDKPLALLNSLPQQVKARVRPGYDRGSRYLTEIFLRWSRYRPNPLAALGLVFGALVLSSIVYDMARTSGEIRDGARESFLQALTATKVQLSGISHEILRDPHIRQTFKDKLPHSLTHSVKVYLNRGVVDGIAIYNENCQRVVNTAAVKGFRGTCPPEGGAPIGFNWSTVGVTPVLTLTQNFSKQLLILAVYLDENWLALYPQLKSAVNRSVLVIGGEEKIRSQVAIATEGKDALGIAHANLISQPSTIDHILPGSSKALQNPLYIPLVLVMIALIMGIWWQREHQRARQESLWSDFINWCLTLNPKCEDLAQPKLAAGDESEERFVNNFQNSQLLISNAFQQKIEDNRKLQISEQSLQKSLDSLALETSSLKEKLAELNTLDSLRHQLQITTSGFLEHMEDNRADSDKLSEYLGDEVAELSQVLLGIVASWEKGISERGARKFVRSLYESKAVANDSNLLSEQLTAMGELASAMSANAAKASVLSHQIAENSQAAARAAGTWYGLSHAMEKPEGTEVHELILQCQELIHLSDHQVSFQNMLGAEIIDGPTLPRSIGVSALFHVYIGLCQSSKQPVKIITRLKTYDSKSALVISALSNAPEETYLGEEFNHQVDLAKSILSPFDVILSILPEQEQLLLIALIWGQNRPLLAMKSREFEKSPASAEI